MGFYFNKNTKMEKNMENNQKKKSNKIKTIILAMLLMFSCCFSCFNFCSTSYASATSDLTAPDVVPDYSLYFKELKEENGAVYVYTIQFEYEDTICASSINISTDLENLNFKNYKLKFIEKTLLSVAENEYYLGTYTYKYLVKDLSVSKNLKRVYDITSIYRPYSMKADGVYPEGSSIPTEIAFYVERCYTFVTNADKTITVSVAKTKTIHIVDKYVGFVRYLGGFMALDYSLDRHFVAFSTDMSIDRLFEVDIYYTSQNINDWNMSSDSFGTKEDNYNTLKYDDKTSIQSGFLWINKYTWNDIQTTSEFISSLEDNKVYDGGFYDEIETYEITNRLEDALYGTTHVLNFAITPYTTGAKHNGLTMDYCESYTRIADVTILRLKFELDGETYNLGAVDDKTTGSDTPIGVIGTTSPFVAGANLFNNIFNWLKNLFNKVKSGLKNMFSGANKILIIILIIALIIFFFPLIVSFFPVIVNFVLAILKLIIKAITGIINFVLNLFGGGRK